VSKRPARRGWRVRCLVWGARASRAERDQAGQPAPCGTASCHEERALPPSCPSRVAHLSVTRGPDRGSLDRVQYGRLLRCGASSVRRPSCHDRRGSDEHRRCGARLRVPAARWRFHAGPCRRLDRPGTTLLPVLRVYGFDRGIRFVDPCCAYGDLRSEAVPRVRIAFAHRFAEFAGAPTGFVRRHQSFVMESAADALEQVPQPAPLGSVVVAFGAIVSFITSLPFTERSRPTSAGRLWMTSVI
jgi:hypothetical protein